MWVTGTANVRRRASHPGHNSLLRTRFGAAKRACVVGGKILAWRVVSGRDAMRNALAIGLLWAASVALAWMLGVNQMEGGGERSRGEQGTPPRGGRC